MGITTDINDPRLKTSADPADRNMQEAYLVLPDEGEFVRLVRRSYIHETCGSVTKMGQQLAETYAKDPTFYSATYCCNCHNHFPVGEKGEFYWLDGGQKVGS